MTIDPRDSASERLAALLDDTASFIRRYVVLSDAQLWTTALWVAHTHTLDAFECTPYLQITSATMRAGKTLLLETFALLVAKPWFTGRTSTAALVRKMDRDVPTLLLDESDAAFTGEPEYAATLRGVLNSGYRRSGYSTLCVGSGSELTVRDFATFGAKAIAGIGVLPSTVADRSVTIELKRMTKGERVERFRERKAPEVAEPIRARLEAWATDAVERLRDARPELPDSLHDRAQDVWEPLMAIADTAGGRWPERARRAAVELMGEPVDPDVNVELLHDIGAIFDDINATFIGSTELVGKLAELDSRPWGDWRHGQSITTRAVAERLRLFGVYPRSNGSVRGYDRDSFEDAWTRYPASNPSTRQRVNETESETHETTCQDDAPLDGSKVRSTPIDTGAPDGLTLDHTKIKW